MSQKSAMITIVGRPNVGKSTLINHLVGEKIAIVSHKPQTTRNRICGIVTHDDTQLVFVDTPGFHKPRTRLGDYMNNVVHDSVADVDAAQLLGQLRAAHAPVILVINKIDTVEKENLLAVIAAYAAKFEFDAVVPVSAKFGDGIPDLLRECARHAADSPFLFPDDMTTRSSAKSCCGISSVKFRTARPLRSRNFRSATAASSTSTRRSTARRPATRASSSARTAPC